MHRAQSSMFVVEDGAAATWGSLVWTVNRLIRNLNYGARGRIRVIGNILRLWLATKCIETRIPGPVPIAQSALLGWQSSVACEHSNLLPHFCLKPRYFVTQGLSEPITGLVRALYGSHRPARGAASDLGRVLLAQCAERLQHRGGHVECWRRRHGLGRVVGRERGRKLLGPSSRTQKDLVCGRGGNSPVLGSGREHGFSVFSRENV